MYHYTECGLDNVWLANGYTVKDTPYGKAISIEHADALHRLLADQLVDKVGRLTGKEFRFLRVQLGMSQAVMARAHGVSEQNVSLWERHGKVPKANDHLLRIFVMGHRTNNKRLRQAIDRMMTVERLVHQRIIAQATPAGWEPVAPDQQELDQAPVAA